MSVQVTLSSSQNIQFTDTKADAMGIPDYCGPRIYAFDGGTMPSFLSIDPTKTNLVLSTMDGNHRGVHNLEFTVTLQHYPLIPGVIVKFKATITCEVFTLSFAPPPATMLVEPGVTQQPYTTGFVTSQSPTCGNPVTFSLLTPQAFLSTLTNPDN